MNERGKNIYTIEQLQEELAQILVNSFEYGRGDLDLQLEYWEMSKQMTGINILDFRPHDLLENEYIKNSLIAAFKEKHGDRSVWDESIPTLIEVQLGKAYRRKQST